MTQVPCWCCGRDTEAVELKVLVPTALATMLDQWTTLHQRTESQVVQEALMLLLMPPKEA